MKSVISNYLMGLFSFCRYPSILSVRPGSHHGATQHCMQIFGSTVTD